MSTRRTNNYQGINPAILPKRNLLREDVLSEDIFNILGSDSNQRGDVSAVFVVDSGGRRHLVIRREGAGFSEVGTEVA